MDGLPAPKGDSTVVMGIAPKFGSLPRPTGDNQDIKSKRP